MVKRRWRGSGVRDVALNIFFHTYKYTSIREPWPFPFPPVTPLSPFAVKSKTEHKPL